MTASDSQPNERFAQAQARFAAVHATDPDARATGYHERLMHWVLALAGPTASEPLQLAAGCQHIRRWALPRDAYPLGRVGYKQWRSKLAQMHADEAEQILREVGYGDPTVTRVRALLLKKGLHANAEVQLFEDAICLTFIERQLAAFARQHDEDKLVSILRKTWKKMSPQGHSAATKLAATLDGATRALIERALSQA